MKILISQIEYIKPPRNFVFDALERWDPVKVEFKYLDREKELIEI